MSKVCIFDHPLIQHKLSVLRDKNTSSKEFRELISEIAMLMCFEATRDLPLEEVTVETPVAVAKCHRLAGKKLAIVPILRAGLGMVDGMVSLIPNAKVGHIGLFRDPETHEPVKYYYKMPADIAERDIIVVDPMLATGGSASAAIQFLKDDGVKHIKLMCIIGCPEGIARMQADHPDVDIYVAACDERLNEHAYIVPGLGDAGDRIFGTKSGKDGKSEGIIPFAFLLVQRDLSVLLLEVADALFYHLLQLAVFRPPLVFGDVAELIQQLLLHTQGVSAEFILHFASLPRRSIDKIIASYYY